MKGFHKASRLVAILLSLGLLCGLSVLPSAAQAPSLTLERGEFIQGDEILAHYTGTSGKDWIAIYNKGDVPGGPASLVYEYTSKTGQPDGTMDFKDADRGNVKELAVGAYDIYLLKDDGFDILAKETFVMKKSGPSITTDKSVYQGGESPVFTYTGSTHPDAWIGVYPASSKTPGSGNPSLVYKYTRDVGQPGGSTDLKQAEGTTTMAELPLGEYYAYLFQDGGYTVLAECVFTLAERDASLCPAPASVKYGRTAARQGYADGAVRITPPKKADGLTGYRLYWGTEAGIFEDYAEIPVRAEKGVTEHLLNGSTMIPYGATRLYAYAVYDGRTQSSESVFAELPKGIAAEREEPLYSFQVFSDTHIQADPNHLHNRHLRMALADIQKTDPDSIAILHVGDVTDNGEVGQYRQYNEIVNSFEDLPFIYCTPGNHDLRNATYDLAIDRFLENTNAPHGYYSEKIGDASFIMLGSQDLDNWDLDRSSAHLRDDQLDFLRAELAKAADGMQPIFVYLHQPLYNTVSGSLPGQNWNGVDKDAEMREIFKQYPQVVFFTGHTHWELDAESPMYAGNGVDATMFNDAAVGYLWTDADTGKEGSQGYYVEVYGDKLLVRGRDFVNAKWIPAAQFIVDLHQNVKGLTAQIAEEDEGLIAGKGQIDALLADIASMPEDRAYAFKAEKRKLTKLAARAARLRQQVETLKGTVGGLPEAGAVALTDKAAVEKAVRELSSFTEEQKSLLGTAAADKLDSLVDAIEALEQKPVESSEPDDTSEPDGSSEPSDSSEPDSSSDPAEPADPSDSAEPDHPSDLSGGDDSSSVSDTVTPDGEETSLSGSVTPDQSDLTASAATEGGTGAADTARPSGAGSQSATGNPKTAGPALSGLGMLILAAGGVCLYCSKRRQK